MLTNLLESFFSLLVHSLTVVTVRAKEAVPNFNILCKIAFAVAVVPSMKPSVEKDNIEVQTAMAQTANKTVEPEADPNGNNMHRIGRHKPKCGHRGSTKAGVEEVRGMGIACVCPAANGLRVAMVVLVDLGIKQ